MVAIVFISEDFFMSRLRYTFKIDGKYKNFSHSPFPHTYMVPPIINNPHQNGTFVVSGENNLGFLIPFYQLGIVLVSKLLRVLIMNEYKILLNAFILYQLKQSSSLCQLFLCIS